MKANLLKEIGLTDSEIKVYLALLNLGSIPVSTIYSHTGMYRKNIYDALSKLVNKGLVAYVIENKKRYFQPKEPENLIRYIEEEKNKLTEKKEELEKSINEFNAKFNKLEPEKEAEILRGLEGIKTILKDCLKYREVLFISSTGLVGEKLPYFWPHYDKERIKRKIMWRLLLNYDAKNMPITKSQYREYKLLPRELSSPNVIYIYGDNVANVLWSEKPLIFLIKDKEVSKSYKKYFHYIWKAIK